MPQSEIGKLKRQEWNILRRFDLEKAHVMAPAVFVPSNWQNNNFPHKLCSMDTQMYKLMRYALSGQCANMDVFYKHCMAFI